MSDLILSLSQKIAFILLLLTCTLPISAQENEPAVLARLHATHFDFIEDLQISDNTIYCLGFKYSETEKRYSILNKYDLKLNLIWSKTIEKGSPNRFNRMYITRDKIFVTGCIGDIEMTGINAQRYLYELNDTGEIVHKKIVGPSTIPSTPIRMLEGKLWWAHRGYIPVRETIPISKMSSMTVVVSYDINKRKVKTYKGKLPNVLPSNLIITPSKIIVTGGFYKNNVDIIKHGFILQLEGKKISEKILERQTPEWLASTIFYPKDGEIHLVSLKAGGPDSLRFVRLESYNFDSRLLSSKRMFKEEIGIEISKINFYTYATEDNIWLLFRQSSGYDYVRFNKKGEELERIKLPFLRSNPRPFFLSSDLQLQAISHEETLGQNVILLTGKQ